MEFTLTNTISGNKERVFAQDNQSLRFYCCGPTVYGPAHIGNFRTFTIQDVFRRTAETVGIKTTHVRNLTDFDDKTIRRSQESGKELVEFTNYWRDKFHADCKLLNNLAPHVEPSAIAHIPEQIKLIEKLVESGMAYQGKDGSVYYRIEAFEEYGKLSGLKKDDRRKNADGRLNDDDEYAKESIADFALWKAWKEDDGPNRWESPWGPGRPGWHIECSAMSMKYLGESYDLHSGGVDLIFPHHENEIAQSEGATHKPFVRHWFHVAHLMVDGAKMSKSLGNLYTLEDIQSKGYSPEELRYVLISGHYRQPLNFTMDSLNAARSALTKLRKFKNLVPKAGECKGSFGPFESVIAALADDLNVAKALGNLFATLSKLEKAKTEPTAEMAAQFEKVCFALGFELKQPLKNEESPVPESISALAQERWAAKKAKDWAEADRIRDVLLEQGWMVKDTKDGFEILPKE